MKIEPKPMSAERRAEIVETAERYSSLEDAQLRDLLADAAFWREKCAEIVDWFDSIDAMQNSLLREGQTLESASDNWDTATIFQSPDFSEFKKALNQ